MPTTLFLPTFKDYELSPAKRGKNYPGLPGYKNAGDTWITKSIYIGYLLTNRFWQLSKYNLGLTCALGGTGMCISVDLLKQYGWGMTSLTEDLEFQTKALLNNVKVNWAHDARVYDEKPLNLIQS